MNGASAIHLSIFGMGPVIKHRSEELRRRVLPAVAAGELQVAFGVTEPDAGTDTSRITTRATRAADGSHYLVRGRKIWTTKAPHCEKVLLLVRTTARGDVSRPTDGMTLLLADLRRPEVDIVPIDKAGRNAVVSCEVAYDDLPVDVADRVGEEGHGFRYLLDGLNPERILIAAEALGTGRAALRRAVAYAGERVVFDRPIGQNQGIAFPLARSHMELRAAELAVREAAWRYDRGLPCGEAASTAKFLAAEAGYAAADRPCRPSGAWATPASATLSATGARPVSCAWHRSARSSSRPPSPPRSSACPRATSSTGRLPGGRSGRSRGSAPVPGDPREPPSRPSVRP